MKPEFTTEIVFTVTDALIEESPAEVAVTVTFPGAEGAVNMPLLLTVPADAFQLIPWLKLPTPVAAAEHWSVADTCAIYATHDI